MPATMGVLKCALVSVLCVHVIYAAKLSAESAEKKGCSQPESVKYGQFYFTTPTTIGYQCRPDYIMVGNDARECEEDGEWTGTAPICIGTRCTFPGYLEKGTAVFSYQGGHVTFECEPGYKLKGKETMLCEGDTWNGSMPECIERGTGGARTTEDEHRDWLEKSDYTCITEAKKVAPPQIENTYRDISWAVFDRQARLYAVYRCKWGYVPKTSQRSIYYCQNGKWLGEEPFCKPVRGGGEDYYIKDSPKGNSRYWSHKDWLKQSDYTCMKKRGVKPPSIRNAQNTAKVEVMGGYPRLYVEYKCHSGFKMADKTRFMYCNDGQWVGDQPQCNQGNRRRGGGLYLRIDE